MVADEASLIAAMHRMRPDVVIVDLSLPASGGAYVARRLTREFAGLKVIVLSVHDESTAVHQVLAAGSPASSSSGRRRPDPTSLRPSCAVLGGGTYVSPAAGSLTVIEGTARRPMNRAAGSDEVGCSGPRPPWRISDQGSGAILEVLKPGTFGSYPKTGYRA